MHHAGGCKPRHTRPRGGTSSAPAVCWEEQHSPDHPRSALAPQKRCRTGSSPPPCRCPPLILARLCPQRNEAAAYPHPSRFGDGFHSVLLTFIALACVAGVSIAAAAAFCLRQHAKQREKERLAALGPEGAADSTLEYQVGVLGAARCGQTASALLGGCAAGCPAAEGWGPGRCPQELCRQHMATKSLFGRAEAPAAPAETSRVSSVSSQFSDAPQPSPSSHSSTPSWCEEPVQSNMDISTGHMILVSPPGGDTAPRGPPPRHRADPHLSPCQAYMEDHLRNRDRLAKEWQALCAYQAEPSVCSVAQSEANLKKNRNPDYVPCERPGGLLPGGGRRDARGRGMLEAEAGCGVPRVAGRCCPGC